MPVAENVGVRIVAEFDYAGVSKGLNVYHAINRTSEGCTDQEMIDVCLDYVENIMAELSTFISDEVSLNKVDVYEWAVDGWGPIGSKVGTWAGTSTTDPLPPGCAMILEAFKLRTGYADRKFIMGIDDGKAIEGVFSAATVSAGEDAAAEWVGEYTDGTATIEPVSYSQKTGNFTEYNGTVSASSVVSYQRRRKQGVGLT